MQPIYSRDITVYAYYCYLFTQYEIDRWPDDQPLPLGPVPAEPSQDSSQSSSSSKSSTKSTKRKYPEPTVSYHWLCPHCLQQAPDRLLTRPVKVWWPDDKLFYPGRISAYDAFSKRHCVEYEDGQWEFIRLHSELVILSGATADKGNGVADHKSTTAAALTSSSSQSSNSSSSGGVLKVTEVVEEQEPASENKRKSPRLR